MRKYIAYRLIDLANIFSKWAWKIDPDKYKVYYFKPSPMITWTEQCDPNKW